MKLKSTLLDKEAVLRSLRRISHEIIEKNKGTQDLCLVGILSRGVDIAKIIAERTGCDVSSVKPESTFAELGIDSLDTVELLMSLEDEIGMEIELDQKVTTVDDLVKFVESKKQD